MAKRKSLLQFEQMLIEARQHWVQRENKKAQTAFLNAKLLVDGDSAVESLMELMAEILDQDYATVKAKLSEIDNQQVKPYRDFLIGTLSIIYDRELSLAIPLFTEASKAPTITSALVAELIRIRGVAKGKSGDQIGEIADYAAVLDMADAPAEQKAKALVNRGVSKGRSGDHAGAIADYTTALNMVGAPAEQKAWALVNRGFAKGESGDQAGAIADYKTVLDMVDATVEQKARVHWGLGDVHLRHHRPEQAEFQWRQAANLFQQIGELSLQAVVNRKLEALAVPKDKRSEDDSAKIETSLPPMAGETAETRIIKKLDDAERDRYSKYQEQKGSSVDNQLVILRGWSSAVPLLEGAASVGHGGGYLLKWRGKGIAIDPGYDFLLNFHKAGFHLRELQGVLVSHHHPDHNEDLKRLDDLFYEMSKRSSIGGEYKYCLAWDSDTASHFQGWDLQNRDRRGCLPLDLSSLFQNPKHCLTFANPFALPVGVRFFPARHTSDVLHATGLRLQLIHDTLAGNAKADFVIGYTGDTEYFDDLADLNHLGECDLLIAHVSQPDEREWTDPGFVKKGHLGYRGAEKLIKKLKPKLTLLGEFWAGLADLRIDITHGLRTLTGQKAILPTSIGMKINLPDLTVECSACRNAVKPDEVCVAPPQQVNGPLSYLCRRCSL